MDIYFNDRLRDYSSSVPADMWNRIIEKKKRDRMIWLFFLRLFTLVVLSLALAGGYFNFNQKKSASIIGMDSAKINHTLIITDTMKASVSNLSAHQNQRQLPYLNEVNKKTNQKEKTRISYVNKFDGTKTNNHYNAATSKLENSSRTQSAPLKKSSASTGFKNVTENKTEDKKDSLGKKPLVKTITPDSSQGKDLKKPETKNKSNDRKWYLDLYASPDYPIVTPHYYDNIVSKLSYTIGVRINRALGKHFSVKTGIQYSQINIIGNDSLFAGATLHIKRLDLPVLVGYSFGNEKLKTTINSGVIFNLNSSVSPDSVQSFFENNLGLSLYLGVNFEKRINEKFSLVGEPYYRYQLSSMTISSISNVKFIDIVGISIGARYYFKK